MAKITYTNKVTLNEQPSVADINKVTDDDMNEIKSVVNTNDDNVGTLSNLNTTDKTSIVNAINELVNLKPVVLYNDGIGTSGTVTLSKSAANYSYIEIYYNINGYQNSSKVYGNKASLTCNYKTSNSTHIATKTVTISGTSITVDGYQEWYNTWGTSNITASNDNNTYITKVLGYK